MPQIKESASPSRRKNRRGGFSLVELMISVALLAVGFAALLALMMTAMTSNNTNRRDTSATTAAQTIMETLSAPPAIDSISMTTVTDCAGNTLTLNTAVGGAPLNSSTGVVDFTQAIVSGYQAYFVACAPTGETQATYDVRWNIQIANQAKVNGTATPICKFITVSAQRKAFNSSNIKNGFAFSLPVTLQTLAGD